MANLTTIKVRGYHLDMFGHVNNARYLEFLEEGRWALFDDHSDFIGKLGDLLFMVVNININYRKPASFGNIITVDTRITKIGQKSAVMSQKICLKKTGDLLADADVTFVIADSKTGRAVPLTGDIHRIIESMADLVPLKTS